MRYMTWGVLMVLIAAFGGACLRDGEPVTTGAGAGPADNSFCYVCHVNYKQETLAQDHAEAGVGCMKCHGDSDAHSSDEENLTPPDIMYPRDRINPACMQCHSRRQIEKEQLHKPVLQAMSEHKKVCTDCHGEHRLKVRTRLWDKATGKLTDDDGVRL